MDMQWNKMLWWMGAILLLACLLLSRRTISQEMIVCETVDGDGRLVALEEKVSPGNGVVFGYFDGVII